MTRDVWGSGGKATAQRYGVVGGKVPLTLPTDLETADDYRILVHEESTGLTCRSDYFTIANAGEVPTPAPVRRAPPTPRPTPPRATHAPTPAPTPSTITFAPEPRFWQKGSTQTVEIRIGDVDQAYSYGFGAVVDLLLYEADGADPVGTLAVYAQVAGNKLSVDYAVPAGLAGADVGHGRRRGRRRRRRRHARRGHEVQPPGALHGRHLRRADDGRRLPRGVPPAQPLPAEPRGRRRAGRHRQQRARRRRRPRPQGRGEHDLRLPARRHGPLRLPGVDRD